MSYKSLLQHRCHILRLTSTSVNGVEVTTYQQITEAPIRCRLDLQLIRHGKDPHWTPEAGRAAERTGVWFGLVKGDQVKSGDRLLMTKGPTGTFLVEGALDDVFDATKLHHVEVGVKEVPPVRAKASRGSNG